MDPQTKLVKVWFDDGSKLLNVSDDMLCGLFCLCFTPEDKYRPLLGPENYPNMQTTDDTEHMFVQSIWFRL